MHTDEEKQKYILLIARTLYKMDAECGNTTTEYFDEASDFLKGIYMKYGEKVFDALKEKMFI